MGQLKSIQVLRALAAMAVMFAHLHGIEERHSESAPLIASPWVSGVSGVDLFFVISGFVMVWVTRDTAASGINAARFLFARVTRIYPLWWLFAGAMSLYFYVTYGVPWDAGSLTPFGVSGPEHLWKSFLLIPHEAYPVLVLGWTLMHEMYFYLIFTLILLLPARFRSLAFLLWAGVIVAASILQMTDFYANSLVSLALFPMTLEFLFGVAAGYALKHGWTQLKWPALALGLVWLIAAILIVDFQSTTSGLPLQRSLAFGPAFALIVYAFAALEQTTQLASRLPSLLVRIGNWSYSLYLGHLLVLSAVARVFFQYADTPGPWDNTAFLILGIAAALIVSGLTYEWFEKPLLTAARKLRTAWFDKPASPVK
ncbi:MAG: acyltransferase [Pseudomonadota bacterium]